MGFTTESPFSSEIFAIQYKICQITLFSHNTRPYELNSLILINLTIKNASFSLQAGQSVTQILGAGNYLEDEESQKMSNQLLIMSNPIGTSKASTITQGGVRQNRSSLNCVTIAPSLHCSLGKSSHAPIETARCQQGFNTIGVSTERPTHIQMSTHGYSLHDHSTSTKAPGKLSLLKQGTSTIPQREVSTRDTGAAITRIGLPSSAHSWELKPYSLLEEGVQQEITGRIQSISHSQSYPGISQKWKSELASPPSPQLVPLGEAEVIANRQQHPAACKQQVPKEINKHQLEQSAVNESDESIDDDSTETQVGRIHASKIILASYSF